MKKFKNTIVAGITAGLLSVTLYSAGDLSAYGRNNQGAGMGKSLNAQSQNQNIRPGWIMKDELTQAQVDVLAELSKQPADTIKTKLQYKSMWTVLDEYKVDFKIFQDKMHEKHLALVEKAVKDGKITENEKKLILDQMELNQSQSFNLGQRGLGNGRGYATNSHRGGKQARMGHGNGMGDQNGTQMGNRGGGRMGNRDGGQMGNKGGGRMGNRGGGRMGDGNNGQTNNITSSQKGAKW
jgi:hypothetical protein